MKGHKEVIEMLNAILTGELTAINQYFLHARICKDWGYERIAKKVYNESIDEMKHAQWLIDRILFLKGLPNLQRLDDLNIGETVPEQLKADLGLEETAVPRLKKAIDLCVKHQDHGTRELLEKILVSEEDHVNWLEAQLHMIKEVGAENYLSQQIREEED
jgi:bacterioferritin